jgi:hypothetical protein
MKKQLLVIIFILPFIIMCSSCSSIGNVKNENTTPQLLPTGINADSSFDPISEPYTYNADTFKISYSKALSDIKDGKILKESAPDNPEDTDFAIIPLGKEIYGIYAFAVLPVLTRALSDEEMLQLAYGMGGISFEQLITPLYSWMGYSEVSITYRPFYWDERIRSYELESMYRYKDRRPSSYFTNDPEAGGPISIGVDIAKSEGGGSVSYWIYPNASMTEEQLLQIIEVQFKGPKEYYQPLETQIQYDEVKGIAEILAKNLRISESTLEECYSYYWSGRSNKKGVLGSPNDYWLARMHFTDGYDYIVTFDADDGSFISWFRCPKGYYAKKEPVDFTLEVTELTDKTYSDKEMKEAAIAYISSAFLKDDIIINEAYVDPLEVNKLFGGQGLVMEAKGKVVKVDLSSGEKYRITVLINDLSIQSVDLH